MILRKTWLFYIGSICATFILTGCSTETSTAAKEQQSLMTPQSDSEDQPSPTIRPNKVPSAKQRVSTLTAQEHCEAVMASIADAGFADEAWVTCLNDRALIHSDSYASHEMMTGIVGTIEQLAVPAPGYFAPVMFNPAFSGIPQTRDSSLAIAVNGVPIFDYSSGGELTVDELYYHQPHVDTIELQETDDCGGHAGMGDDYHYHELPRCMLEQMDNKDENPIIGWGFDGFPLYANNNPDGSPIEAGTLDVCNGQLDPVFGYRYHTSDSFPYIIQCIVGDMDDLNSVPTIGMANAEGHRRPAGGPVNVENLTFRNDESGAGYMAYEYEGESYFIEVVPTEDESCFVFSWNIIGNDRNPGTAVESSEYCHIVRTGGMGGGMGMGMGEATD